MLQHKYNMIKTQFLLLSSISIFAIFVGSQITEGVLLVPYWKSLSSNDFYLYFEKYGPSIGKFYTILTVCAALVPIMVSIYCKSINSNGFKYAIISSFLAVLFVLSFYAYFKGANELFDKAVLNDIELEKELIKWGYYHWVRVFIEGLSLVFLILSIIRINIDSVESYRVMDYTQEPNFSDQAHQRS